MRQDAVRPRVADPKGGGGHGEDVAGLGLFLVCVDWLSFAFQKSRRERSMVQFARFHVIHKLYTPIEPPPQKKEKKTIRSAAHTHLS